MAAPNLKVLIGWKEIAAYLDCSRSTAVRRLEDGLPVFRVGGSVRAFAVDIDRWLERAPSGDMTEVAARKRAAEVLRDSEEKYRLIIESSPAGMHMYELTADGRLIFTEANPAADRILGVDNSQFVGKTIEEAFPPLADTEIPERYRRAAADGEPWHAEQIDYEDERITGAFDVTAFQTSPGKMAALFLDLTGRIRAEEALRESEEKYRNIFEHSPAGIVIHQEGKVLFLSPAMLRIIGYDSAEEVIGKPIMEFVHPDYRKQLTEEIEAVYARGGELGEPSELIIIRKDGSTLSVTSVAQTIAYKGAPAIQAYVLNNSERKLAEEALRESEERYRTLFEGSPAAVTVVNPAGVIVEINKATEELTGYSGEELRGKRFDDLVTLPPEELPEMTAKYEALLRGDVGEPYDLEIIRKDGTTRWIRVRNSLLSEGETLAGIQVTSLDITDRKRAQEALKESEEKFRNLVERSNDGIAIVIEGRLAYVNPRIGEVVGCAEEEMLGEPFAGFIDPVELPKVSEYYERRMRGESAPGIYETAILRADGSKMHVELNVGMVSYRGQHAELVFIRDLTERKKAEETRERERKTFRIIAEAAVHATSIRDLCRRVVTGLAEALGFEIGDIRLYEEETETLERTASCGMTRDEIDDFFPTQHVDDRRYFAAHVARTREPIFAPEVTKHDIAKTHRPRIEELKIAAVISWPILGAEGTLLGVVSLASRTPKDIAEEDRGFFETVAGMFATVLERRRAEDGVRKSEAKHRLLLESIGSPVLALDANMNVLYYNDAYAACMDLPRQGMEGKNLLEALPSFAETESYAAYAEALSTDTPREAEGEFGGRYLRTSVYPMPWGILTVAADITERRRAEEALRESEERYRVLFERGNDAVFVFNLTAQGKPTAFVEVNNEACRYLGYSAAELHELTPADLVPPERRKAVADIIRRLVEERELLFEWVHVRKDGTEVPVEVSSLLFEFRREPTVISIVRDITERKRADEALRESEEKYRNLFHGSKDAVFIHDLEGNIFDANEQVSALFGYSPEETVSLRISDLHPPEALPASRDAFAEISRTGSVTFEIDFKRKDGGVFPAEVSASLFEVGGKKVIQGVVRDITERKRAETELRRAAREKTAILSSMSEHVVYHNTELEILWANEAAASSVGLSPESLIGRHCYEVWHARKQPCEICPVAAAIETGGPHEEEMTTPDGRSWFIRGYPIKDEVGKVTNAVEVTLEITERKRAEEALKQALTENEALLEAVPDLMFVIDREGNYVDFKRADADRFALSPETIIGKNVRDTGFSAEDERKVLAGLERTFRTGEPSAVQYELDTPGGHGTFEARLAKLNDEQVLSVVREITQREAPHEN
jgi:PAS domain S-box-containing protein